MIAERGGSLQPEEGQTEEVACWAMLCGWLVFKRKGYRCNFNRFHGVIVDGRQLFDKWYFHLFRTSLLALECDMVGGAKMKTRQLSLRNRADPDADTGRTSTTQIDEKAIRACSQNAMANSVLVLGDFRNRRMLACILHASECVTAWHRKQNVECRDVDRGARWFLGEMHGGLLRHTHCMLASFTTSAATAECGFGVQMAGAKAMADEEVSLEEEMATTLGQLCLYNVVARAQRWAVVLNCWDHQVFMCLDPTARAEVLTRFQRQVLQHDKLKAVAGPSKRLQSILKRSCFNMVSVQQLIEGFKAGAWKWTPDMEALLRKRTLSCYGTQVIEDINNVQKNHVSVTASTVENKASYRRPELSWATALRRGVVDRTHRFRKLNVGGAVPRKSDALPPQWFAPSTNATEQVPFERLAGFNVQAD